MPADALVKTLNQGGFMPVFLARPGMSPPDIYTVTDGGRLERHGPLKSYLKDKTVTYGVQTNPFQGIVLSHTSEKSLQGAASFLTSALKVIGIGAAPKLNLAFAGSDSFIFSFEDVTIESVDSVEIETTLDSLDLSVMPAKDKANGRLHVAYEYLCAKTLLMCRSDKKNFTGNIQGAVGDYIDVGISGVIDASNSAVIRFKSATQGAPFAYKSGGLQKRNGKWQFRVSQVAADFVGIPGSPAAEALPYLPARGVVLSPV